MPHPIFLFASLITSFCPTQFFSFSILSHFIFFPLIFSHRTFFLDVLLAKVLFPTKSYIIKPATSSKRKTHGSFISHLDYVVKACTPAYSFQKGFFFSDALPIFPLNFFLVRFIDPRFFAQLLFFFLFHSISFHFPMKSYIIKPAN